MKPAVSFDDFTKLGLRVGTINPKTLEMLDEPA